MAHDARAGVCHCLVISLMVSRRLLCLQAQCLHSRWGWRQMHVISVPFIKKEKSCRSSFLARGLLLLSHCLAPCLVTVSSSKQSSGKAANKKDTADHCGVSPWIVILPLGSYSVMTIICWPRHPEPRTCPWSVPRLGQWLNNPLDLLWFNFFPSWNFLYFLELNQSFPKVCISQNDIVNFWQCWIFPNVQRIWVGVSVQTIPQNVKWE